MSASKTKFAPKDKWEAINMLVSAEQELAEAASVMQSILDNPGEDYAEIHERRIKAFFSRFNQEPTS